MDTITKYQPHSRYPKFDIYPLADHVHALPDEHRHHLPFADCYCYRNAYLNCDRCSDRDEHPEQRDVPRS